MTIKQMIADSRYKFQFYHKLVDSLQLEFKCGRYLLINTYVYLTHLEHNLDCHKSVVQSMATGAMVTHV